MFFCSADFDLPSKVWLILINIAYLTRAVSPNKTWLLEDRLERQLQTGVWSFEFRKGRRISDVIAAWIAPSSPVVLPPGYNKDVRPRPQNKTILPVTFGVALTQIISLDERYQILTTNCWLNLMWVDDKLKWDPLKFGNLTQLLVPVEKIWKPDILLFNTADAAYYQRSISTNVILHHTGNVTWLISSIFKSTCELDVRNFPFDQQKCQLKFASWTYNADELNLVLITADGDLSSYVRSGEWDLMSMKAQTDLVVYNSSTIRTAPHPQITITLVMRRRPLFYVFTYLIPCFGATFFVLLGFILPGECSEKVFLDIKVLLSLVLFFFTVGEVMPPTALNVPLISLYYVISMLFVSLATGVQVWTLNLHYRGSRGQKLPAVLKLFSLCKKKVPIELVRSASLENPTKERTDLVREDLDNKDFNRHFGERNNARPKPTSPLKKVTSPLRRGRNGFQQSAAPKFLNHYRTDLDVFEKRLSKILTSVCDMIEKSERRITHLQRVHELTTSWQNMVAVTMDRILLTIFTLAIVTVFLVLYLRVSYDQ